MLRARSFGMLQFSMLKVFKLIFCGQSRWRARWYSASSLSEPALFPEKPCLFCKILTLRVANESLGRAANSSDPVSLCLACWSGPFFCSNASREVIDEFMPNSELCFSRGPRSSLTRQTGSWIADFLKCGLTWPNTTINDLKLINKIFENQTSWELGRDETFPDCIR